MNADTEDSDPSEMTDRSPIGETQFPLDDFRAALADLFAPQAFVTNGDLSYNLTDV
jgi:hypothetical protein